MVPRNTGLRSVAFVPSFLIHNYTDFARERYGQHSKALQEPVRWKQKYNRDIFVNSTMHTLSAHTMNVQIKCERRTRIDWGFASVLEGRRSPACVKPKPGAVGGRLRYYGDRLKVKTFEQEWGALSPIMLTQNASLGFMVLILVVYEIRSRIRRTNEPCAAYGMLS